MTEADFGFDESQWAQAGDELDAGHGTVIEKLPDVVVTEDTPIVERLKILKSRYPELEPLSRDYTSLQTTYEELQVAAETASASTQKSPKKRKAGQEEPTPSIAVLKWRALSTYLGSIAMYFAILTAPASEKSQANVPTSPAELRQHPVMQSLLRSRQSWDTVKDLQLPQTEEIEEKTDAPPEEMQIMTQPVKVNRDVPDPTLSVVKPTKKSKTPDKLKATASSSKSTETRSLPRKDPAASTLLNSLDALIASVKAPSVRTTRTSYTSPSHSSKSSDFGDELPLTSSETASKAARKRNLRFYTSQLAQKSNKRAHASQNAGGDADLPYKERLKDRQVRLLKEAEVRGMDKGKGAARGREMDFRDDDEDDDQEMTNGDRNAGGDNDEEDYYQTITSASRAKKAQKAARSEAANSLSQAAAVGQAFPDSIDPSGKRAITYEISANKGLMPRRKKEVRNPRVKKRMKYDQKMKKLGSVRQVYKGGEGRGGYAGELTGIKTNVVRAVKL
jgi:U3 small nucleolar RNA-associated protein 3